MNSGSEEIKSSQTEAPRSRKDLALKLLIASSIGIVVFSLSLYTAWQDGRKPVAGRQEQWRTQRTLEEMAKELSKFHSKQNFFPPSLKDVEALEHLAYTSTGELGDFLDGWGRLF